MLVVLVLKNCVECTSQHLKRMFGDLVLTQSDGNSIFAEFSEIVGNFGNFKENQRKLGV